MDISVNSFDYSGNFKFTFTNAVELDRLSPACGPIDQKTRVQMIGTGLKENKDTLIEKSGVMASVELKNSEAKSLVWSESEFLASMLMSS